jgi:hypothetical protein
MWTKWVNLYCSSIAYKKPICFACIEKYKRLPLRKPDKYSVIWFTFTFMCTGINARPSFLPALPQATPPHILNLR